VSVTAGSARATDVILAGGFAAGLLDILNAIAFWWIYSGTSPQAILQSIAAGLMGKSAFAGGAATAALGLCLHFAIMFAMAAVYWLAGRQWPWMIARPLAAGVGYGLLTWGAMNYVVVPLSRAQPPPFIPAWFADGLLAHVLLVGLVFAFVARRSAGGVSLLAVPSGTRRGT
jgi:hypothetical protein